MGRKGGQQFGGKVSDSRKGLNQDLEFGGKTNRVKVAIRTQTHWGLRLAKGSPGLGRGGEAGLEAGLLGSPPVTKGEGRGVTQLRPLRTA